MIVTLRKGSVIRYKAMGRKGTWFSSVKKALSPDSKELKDPKSSKSKKKWFGKQKQLPLDLNDTETARAPSSLPPPPPVPPSQYHHQAEEVILIDEQNEEIKHIESMETNETALDVPEAVPVIVATRFTGKSGEEVAAIKIQTAFRGYQARRALRALRGLVRLKSLIEGPTVKRQVSNTMHCMQTLARLQSQIHARRLRMSEENQALQRQLLQKQAKELENLKIGEEWDQSLQSKEQIETNLLKKFEATMRRERALAYAFTHQQNWKNQPKSTNPMFLDPTNPAWGWSWLERWMAARPWEKDSGNNDNNSSTKNNSTINIAGEISKSYARYQLNSGKDSPTASQKSVNLNSSFQSSSTPPSRKPKPPVPISPKSSIGVADQDDSKSMVSVQSELIRRHSVGAAMVRDDESLSSSASVPSYMVATKSARAKSRFQSPAAGPEKNGTPEKVSPGVAKKRLSFPPSSPARPRRYSAPPKVSIGSSGISETSMASGLAS